MQRRVHGTTYQMGEWYAIAEWCGYLLTASTELFIVQWLRAKAKPLIIIHEYSNAQICGKTELGVCLRSGVKKLDLGSAQIMSRGVEKK